VASLTSGFVSNIDNSDLPDNVKTYITTHTKTGVEIVPSASVEGFAISKGATPSEAAQISSDYREAQLKGLKTAIFALAAIATLSLLLSRNIPNQVLNKTTNS
jgi:hypothetical protein